MNVGYAANSSIINKLQDKLEAAVTKFMTGEMIGFSTDETDEFFVKDYFVVEVGEYESEWSGPSIKCEVRAELSFSAMTDLLDELNPIVAKYDKDAYFDMEDSGIAVAYISVSDKNESINNQNTKLQIKESNDTITVNEAVLGDLEKFIEKKLDEDSLWASNINVYNEKDKTINIDISIEWGDWKHEHLRLDHLMYDIIYEYNRDLVKSFYKVNEEITEEDSSDTYSSIHKYKISID